MSPPPFRFATTEGAQLCRQIVEQKLHYDPHDYVVEGVCRVLDGRDLLAVTPTGSGKTSFLIVYLAVMNAILEDSQLCPSARFPKNPAMIVVIPTKSLELDMEPKFSKAGITALVINKDTMNEARCRKPPVDLWEKAAAPEVQAILLSPEQLRTKGYSGLMENDTFQRRIVAMGVDEAHLLDEWGDPSFRPAFKQIGHARARLSGRAALIALTATLRHGAAMRSVCEFLGLIEGQFHFIRRSNIRYDIRLEFRTVSSGARSTTFPELDWVLDEGRRVIVFCRTIALGFRVAVYLWRRAKGLPDRDERIRLYNALNASSYNCATLALLRDDHRSRVTIATDTLAVGIDAPNTDDVVLYEHELPNNTDTIVQKIGRIRDGTMRGSRGIVYLPRNAEEQARKLLSSPSNPPPRKCAKTAPPRTSLRSTDIDTSTARLILASCKITELNILYDNPPEDPPCQCSGCREKPRPVRPIHCLCCGCTSAVTIASKSMAGDPPGSSGKACEESEVSSGTDSASHASAVPAPLYQEKQSMKKVERLTKKMREHAKDVFCKFRRRIWWNEDALKAELHPSEDFFPELLMDVVLDDFYALTDVASLDVTLMDFALLRDHHTALLDIISTLRVEFATMRAEARAAANERRRATLRAQKEVAIARGEQPGGLPGWRRPRQSKVGEGAGRQSDAAGPLNDDSEAGQLEMDSDLDDWEEGDSGESGSGESGYERTISDGASLVLRIPGGRMSAPGSESRGRVGTIRIPGGRMHSNGLDGRGSSTSETQ
ncbi:ATP-dependent DNA helicase RecQ [Trametes pubescens]|uniref:DNA 3'-5' helicase n=1 Tax=Trametes pubescens TaxID=154538 RepID=A0A1M2VFK1_TRAPU|nr:ATP-dependent DNA helicase RecQ [Trametes pubescens]